MKVLPKKPCNGAAPATKFERETAYRIAALADVDPRTALRALREGPAVVRVISTRERIAEALAAIEAQDTKEGP